MAVRIRSSFKSLYQEMKEQQRQKPNVNGKNSQVQQSVRKNLTQRSSFSKRRTVQGIPQNYLDIQPADLKNHNEIKSSHDLNIVYDKSKFINTQFENYPFLKSPQNIEIEKKQNSKVLRQKSQIQKENSQIQKDKTSKETQTKKYSGQQNNDYEKQIQDLVRQNQYLNTQLNEQKLKNIGLEQTIFQQQNQLQNHQEKQEFYKQNMLSIQDHNYNDLKQQYLNDMKIKDSALQNLKRQKISFAEDYEQLYTVSTHQVQKLKQSQKTNQTHIQTIQDMKKQFKNLEVFIQFQHQFEIILCCNYCSKQLKKACTIIPCGHSYCKNCYEGYQKECYICGPHKKIDVLYSNSLFDDIIMIFNRIQKQKMFIVDHFTSNSQSSIKDL